MVTGGRYGFMRDVEEALLDKIFDTIKGKFGEIRGIEVGVMGAGTTRGIYQRGKEIGCPVQLVGIDFEQYRPNPTPDPDYEFIAQDSMDAFRNIKGKGYNFLFVDGCHCVNHSMCDFLNYSPFIVAGGYALFHDTALPKDGVEQGQWPQNHSYAGTPDSVLGVREGLKKLGLLQGYRSDWQLVEEIPSSDGLMGMCLFQKLKDL